MNETIVTLKKGEGRAFKAGGLWIYDNEIESIHGTFKNGTVVTVQEQNGCPLGRGFINQNSKIRVRMLTRDASQEIDDAFLEMRVRNAWAYRKRTVDTSACRVIFGEADFLPGLVIDKFSDVLVVESLALGIDKMKLQIVDILKKVLLEDGIKIRGVYERSDAKERLKEGMDRKKGFIGDEFDTDVETSSKTACATSWTLKTARRPAFSSTKNITVSPCSASARIWMCSIASHTRAPSR